MKVSRKALLDALTVLKPGVSNKEWIEHSTHFIFINDFIFTTDGMINISVPFTVGFTGAVQADKLFAVINKMTGVDIDFEVAQNELLLKCGRTRAGIKIDPDIKLLFLKTEGLKRITLPSDFAEAAEFCSFSVANKAESLILSCVYAKDDYIVSCDNYRLTKKTLSEPMESPVILPAVYTLLLAKYKPVEYAIDIAWIHFFCCDDVVVSCRRVNEVYPDVDKFFQIEGATIKIPSKLLIGIEKAEILASVDDQKHKFITLTFSQGKVTCKGEEAVGWIEESYKMDYTGEELVLKIQPHHFMEILRHLDTVVLGESALLFSGADFKHVISLMG